ncbi:hypothetical protein [Diaminobutyricimonas sp. TR449]|uniref:hypothetical protein n=1 Tax=Diaminobutyricimonas sp. TR449 TaxID=2708076 RepID=UPI00141EBEF7|nr:hypothetical protein [Diaminobutyricimonas sp. TR449]
MSKIPAMNLPPEATPWGREMQKRIEDMAREFERMKSDQTNTDKAQTGAANLQARQIRDLRAAVGYQESLITRSGSGGSFSTGTQPGDSTFRHYIAPGTSLTLRAATGRVLVTVSAGEASIDPGETSAVAEVTFEIRRASNGELLFARGSAVGRLFSTSGRRMGASLSVIHPRAVPADEDIIVTAWFGIWSASTTTLASATFNSPSIIVQVIEPGATGGGAVETAGAQAAPMGMESNGAMKMSIPVESDAEPHPESAPIPEAFGGE